MPSTYVSIQQQLRSLHCASTSCHTIRSHLSHYREEVTSLYQSDETNQIVMALNQCMEQFYTIVERCDALQERFLFLEKLSL